MSKNKIIYDMCMKIRHDYGFDYEQTYGIDGEYNEVFSYLSKEDKQKLWNDMEKIYDAFVNFEEELGEDFEKVLLDNLDKLYVE